MGNVLAVRDEYRLQNWMQIIRECQKRGISEKTYYYWLRKLRSAEAEAMEPQLVRLDDSVERDARLMIHIRYGEAELKLPEDGP